MSLPYTIRNIAELSGHEDRAWQLAWNPKKKFLASCSGDRTVRIYAYHEQGSHLTFDHISTIPTGHTKAVRSVAWAPSGETLATGSFDSRIGIWEQEETNEDGEKTGEWECVSLLEGHETECKSVAYSSTGTLLATCSRDKTVWIWEVQPGADFECLSVIIEHTQDVKYVAWHPTEEILASASYDDTIKLYIDDPSDDWYCFATLTGHTSTVWSVAWSPDGNYLASASDDRSIRIWKRLQEHIWETCCILEGHERSVYSVSWGKGKSGENSLGWIASVGGEGTINIWDIQKPLKSEDGKMTVPSKHLMATLPLSHGIFDTNAVSWCPREGHEDILATAGDDGIIRVWRVC